tara:strand:+ start:501 stop:629 length:129 start_codon:yes stop_codon:yes gene_type:complete
MIKSLFARIIFCDLALQSQKNPEKKKAMIKQLEMLLEGTNPD